jgi:hypothetical protein
MVIADISMFLIGAIGVLVALEARRSYPRMRLIVGLFVMLVLFATWLYEVLFLIHWV